ncbi:MAG: ATP-binding protein [Acidobacteriota bacterium]
MGRHYLVSSFLTQKAAGEATPSDWCYINNFAEPDKPIALRLPPSQALMLREDMQRLLEELYSAVQSAFEGDNYRTRKQAIEKKLKEREEREFGNIQQEAEREGIAMTPTPAGIAFTLLRNGKLVGIDELPLISDRERQHFEDAVANLQEQIRLLSRKISQWEREGREEFKQLKHETATLAVGHLIDEVKEKYKDLPDVITHLNAVQKDVVDNVSEFLKSKEEVADTKELQHANFLSKSPFLKRYSVNVLVDHSATKGVPVIYEDNSTFHNLVGQIDHISLMGTLLTDFTLLRAGALHRANGGYLILDAYKVLLQPYAWEGLKRTLRSSKIVIESLGQMLSLISTISIKPQPIPLNMKVVLIGERLLYYLLSRYDPEFDELFKVTVDFEDEMDRNPENSLLYARLIGTDARKEGMLPFDRNAVARIIEHSARMASDSKKLSAHMRMLVDLLREADYWAAKAGRSVVTASDVQEAIDNKIYRMDRQHDRVKEAIENRTILIDTDGEKIGRINGLSIIDLGNIFFGFPSRITARVRLDKGEVIDVEREVELGGPIHSKGVLILSGFLASRYALERPLSLSATLVFEQSYSGVEGDSASSAELYALLSALAEIPIKQSMAVTGSVDQEGNAQAIGGVNDKIEGFFYVCRVRGLTGKQGVIIPASNVRHLMLRQDVVEAVAAKQFHIFPVETIDQGIEILTGIAAGERDKDGKYPKGSINYRVEARLVAMASQRMAFNIPPKVES